MTTTNDIDWTNWIYRLIAYIIDSIIIAIPSYIIYWLLVIPLATTSVDYGFGVAYAVTAWWAFWLLPLILGIIEVVYFAILEVSWGSSIGKRFLKLQVQTVNGGKLDFGKAFVRNISKIYGLFLFIDWLIGIVSAGNKNQRFLDRSAGAVVVRVGEPFASTPPPPPPPPT
jgi:uncharacterized RDD family membrane protein YckC